MVKSRTKKWDMYNNIPAVIDFEKDFTASYSTSVQGTGQSKVKCSFQTMESLSKIKYCNFMLTTASPEFLIDLHSNLKRKDDLQHITQEE
eukprot:11145360-Ditylum_brightwellii.AAC.1